LIPHSRPRFAADCVRILGDVVNSGHTARGPVSEALEARIAGRLDMPYAAAVDSGSSALLLALFALSMDKPVRKVGIPAYVCRALLHAVRAFGAEPVCMDCTADLRLDPLQAETLAPTLDAVILVHPFGMVEPLVAEDWSCPVIEDIAQAAGGRLKGRVLGSFGEMSVASFYATKPWGGACGGMVLSREPGFNERICRMRDIDTAEATLPHAGNHQLSDVHAALADCRVQRSDVEMQHRRELADRYDAWLQDKRAVRLACDAEANRFRYIVRVDDADRTIEALRANGVGAAHPVATPVSRLLGQVCPGAETARRQCVSLPLLADMSDDERERMYGAITTCV